jgi:RsmE family RNA methyltransferase
MMNRIMVDAAERMGSRVVLGDTRAEHVRSVLKAEPGDILRCGIVDGPLAEGTVVEVTADEVILELKAGDLPPRPKLDLILAMPRPKVLKRLLPQLAAIGVDRLLLCGAERVEAFYFASHVLETEKLRGLLVEGGAQSGVPSLPQVEVVKRFASVIHQIPERFPNQDRVVLHPSAVRPFMDFQPGVRRAVLAIGPEGGWVPAELEALRALDFCPYGLGSRILRSDTACILAVGMMSQWLTGGGAYGGS